MSTVAVCAVPANSSFSKKAPSVLSDLGMKLRNTVRDLAAALTVWGLAFAAEVRLIDEIVAKVNGDVITRSELERARQHLEAEHDKDTLRNLIDHLLLVQKGKEIGINVDTEVSRYLADVQKRSGIADPDKFQRHIREQSGQTFEDFKSDLRNLYLKERVIRQEVGGRLSMPRAELEKHYNENKQKYMRDDRVFLREILISTEGKDQAGVATAEKKARDLAARARKGESFPELARDNSDSVTRDSYGELPGATRPELDKQIADLAFAADRGFISDPIRVPRGFVILKVEARHKAGLPSFEEVEQEIMNEMIRPKFPDYVREFVTKLRYESFLEIKPGYVDTGAVEGKSTAWTDPAQLAPATVTKEEVLNPARNRRAKNKSVRQKP